MNFLTRLLLQSLVLLCTLSAFSQLYAAGDDPSAVPSTSTASGAPIPGLAEQIKAKANDIAHELIQVGASEEASKVGVEIRKLNEYGETRVTCASREKTTEFICRENTNPAIVEALPVIQAIMTGVAGAKDACSSFAKATDVLNKALVAYQVACAATKTMCQNSCGNAQKNLISARDRISSIVDSAPNNLEAKREVVKLKSLIDKELGGDVQSVASNMKNCTGFNRQIASAMIGAVGVVKSMGQANKCKDALTVPTPTPIVSGTPDCNLPTNAHLTTCICQKNERAVGCGTGLDNPANLRHFEIPNGPTDLQSSSTGKNADPTIPSGGTDPFAGTGAKGGDSGGAGAPTGGGGSGIDGGGGAGGGPEAPAQRGSSRLNANILGGEGGGGSGGGGGYWGGDEGNPALRKYLPGGEKDPTAMAGKAAIRQITSQGGKSNWEKVRESYIKNKPTLLGY